MTEAARQESVRIHREEERMRKERAELHQREKAIEERAAALAAEDKHLTASHHNPTGGADLVVVTRPKRAIKATQNPDGTPIIRQVKQTRGELGGRARLARAVDANAVQSAEDVEMVKKLGAKRKAADAPPAKGRAPK